MVFILFSFVQSGEIVKINGDKFSADRYGNIYYVTKNQDVKKYGFKDLIYSSSNRRRIDHIEAWNSIKIFLFSREFQQYTLLDRYLTEVETVNFNPDKVGFISFATIALDGNVWAIDNSDYSLKKIDIISNKIINTTNLNFIIDQNENEILFMREYSNYLYISTAHNGVLVFDNLGTYKKKLPFDSVDFFSFDGDEMYFLKDEQLIFFNLLKLDKRIDTMKVEGRNIIIQKSNKFIIN